MPRGVGGCCEHAVLESELYPSQERGPTPSLGKEKSVFLIATRHVMSRRHNALVHSKLFASVHFISPVSSLQLCDHVAISFFPKIVSFFLCFGNFSALADIEHEVKTLSSYVTAYNLPCKKAYARYILSVFVVNIVSEV